MKMYISGITYDGARDQYKVYNNWDCIISYTRNVCRLDLKFSHQTWSFPANSQSVLSLEVDVWPDSDFFKPVL